MKVKIIFKHSKKSKLYSFSPATWHLAKDCSTAPVIMKGCKAGIIMDLKPFDTLEYSTTKFDDEIEFKVFRRGRLVNGPTAAAKKRVDKKMKRNNKLRKQGKLKDWAYYLDHPEEHKSLSE